MEKDTMSTYGRGIKVNGDYTTTEDCIKKDRVLIEESCSEY